MCEKNLLLADLKPNGKLKVSMSKKTLYTVANKFIKKEIYGKRFKAKKEEEKKLRN